VAGEPEKGHVEDFAFFVTDLRNFVDDVVLKGGHANYFLIGHSMGGAIASLYLEENSKPFQAAAMTSPMHEIQSLGGQEPNFLCSAAGLFARIADENYVVGGHGYRPAPYDRNDYTNSPVRYQRLLDQYERVPAVQLGSPTHGWASRACEASATARSEADKIAIPVRLFQAERDGIVHPDGHREFCENYRKAVAAGCDGKGGGPIVMQGAKHELLIETDVIRNEVVAEMLSFFEKNRKP
jgi:lysophospholipase